MAKANPVTDQERETVRQLHAEGLGRNAIAKQLKRSGRTISEIAGELGLSFARAAEVRAATEVRQADLAALRAQLALDLTQDAMKLRAQMWEQTTVYSFGGKENSYNDHTFDEAPAAEKRALMGTAGMAIDRSLKLSPPESDTEGLAAVDAWLKGMMGGS
ncbi:helix-turn-helix domain-containing protein [Streptomyces rubiginosohelvolus]|uniref:helix-turn-helix domain-containing protein n=1 Tax=Streptomyces rubiginosohelvolus TaxID=67362 RepID=UPI0035D9F3B4